MIWFALKQYDQDRNHPDSIKEREAMMAKKISEKQPAKKQSKKMPVNAMAHWHNIHDLDRLFVKN
jgi:hypothetical protein